MRRFFIGENEISFVTTYAACYIFEVIHLIDDIGKFQNDHIDVVDGYWRHFYVSVKFEMQVTDLGCKLPISNLTVEHHKNSYYDFL